MIPRTETRRLLGADNAEADVISVAAEILGPVDVSDLIDVRFHTTQIVDDGTVTLLLQYSLDGVYWCTHATLDQDSFAAAAEAVVVTRLANGSTVPMPLAAKWVRVVGSALSSATAKYAVSVIGRRLPR